MLMLLWCTHKMSSTLHFGFYFIFFDFFLPQTLLLAGELGGWLGCPGIPLCPYTVIPLYRYPVSPAYPDILAIWTISAILGGCATPSSIFLQNE